MRISDWSSDVCSSDLVPAPTTAAASPLPLTPAPGPASTPTVAIPSGEHFMTWLQQGIASRRLIINDAKALVHTVSDTAYLVSPGLFKRYAQEHPQVGTLAKQESQQDWQWRSEEHTSELQPLMRISYAAFCLNKKHNPNTTT